MSTLSSIQPRVSAPAGVIVAGTLDTKSEEIAFVRDELRKHGFEAIIIDCGVLGAPALEPTISRADVARAGGTSIEELRSARNREVAIPTMIRGLEATLRHLLAEGRVLGYLGIGGGTNAAFASAAFKLLPFGLPKMLVSTVAAGDTRGFIGMKDVMLMHSVVDVLGLNRFLRSVLRQACAGMAGMVSEAAKRPSVTQSQRLMAGLTAFGSTTAAATRAWGTLANAGIEVLTFHARGVGGQAMESLVREGQIGAVLDLTITEIADELVGGIFSAGQDRLAAAAEAGIPQVILPGSIDMVNFGQLDTIPERFRGRKLVSHTPMSTLMRTTPDENAAMAVFVANKLNRSTGPTAVVLPLRGFSAYDAEGAPFFDPAADDAFRDTLVAHLNSCIPVKRVDAHINEPVCADTATALLLEMIDTVAMEKNVP